MIFISNFPFENRIVRTARRSKTEVGLYGVLVFGDDGSGPTDESKRTKRVQRWSRQIMGGRLLLFAILLLCEITTSFV